MTVTVPGPSWARGPRQLGEQQRTVMQFLRATLLALAARHPTRQLPHWTLRKRSSCCNSSKSSSSSKPSFPTSFKPRHKPRRNEQKAKTPQQQQQGPFLHSWARRSSPLRHTSCTTPTPWCRRVWPAASWCYPTYRCNSCSTVHSSPADCWFIPERLCSLPMLLRSQAVLGTTNPHRQSSMRGKQALVRARSRRPQRRPLLPTADKTGPAAPRGTEPLVRPGSA